MKISKIRIQNYKSFWDSDNIEFSPECTVILGQNNVGKTALLEALSLQFSPNPHRSEITLPRRNTPNTNTQSFLEVVFELEWKETFEIIHDHLQKIYLPVSEGWTFETAKALFESMLSEPIRLVGVFEPNDFKTAYFPKYGDITRFNNVLQYRTNSTGSSLVQGENTNAHTNDLFAIQLARVIRNRIYLFRAERLGISESLIGTNPVLNPNASNLPEVLHLLSRNPNRYERFNDRVREIFPDIHHVTSVPVSDTRVRIQIWTTALSSERDDLAVSLAESGTGVGQVLAMLYVVLNSDFPRVIIIDEPQSFLHPGAVRKLFDIFARYPEHQYIITTHSPIALSAMNSPSILFVKKLNSESKIESIDANNATKLRMALAEVGTRLSDVFGADSILWVEGQTEEQSFPLIISKLTDISVVGRIIRGVVSTGDFKSKYKRRIVEIYSRLSHSESLLPPAIGFVFDAERLSESEQVELQNMSKTKPDAQPLVHFLPRRMFENYLLNPKAIATVMKGVDGFSLDVVTSWLKDNKTNREFFTELTPQFFENLTEERWLKEVDGAKLLNRMFNDLSETKVNYDGNKVEYGVALTNWIIENSPEDLHELVEFLKPMLG